MTESLSYSMFGNSLESAESPKILCLSLISLTTNREIQTKKFGVVMRWQHSWRIFWQFFVRLTRQLDHLDFSWSLEYAATFVKLKTQRREMRFPFADCGCIIRTGYEASNLTDSHLITNCGYCCCVPVSFKCTIPFATASSSSLSNSHVFIACITVHVHCGYDRRQVLKTQIRS